MPGGRPPIPTEHLKLHGGLRKRRHAARSSEFSPDGSPLPVAELSGDAKAAWEFLVPRLPIAREVDSLELTALCEWWAEYRRWVNADDGECNYRRLLGATVAYKQFRALAGCFALTPRDRVNIQSPEATNEDELADLIAG